MACSASILNFWSIEKSCLYCLIKKYLSLTYNRYLAIMATVNMVKYYFYKGMMPKDPELLQNMVSLAYQTARDRKLYPKSILIRYVNYLMMQYQKKKKEKKLLNILLIGLDHTTLLRLMGGTRRIPMAGIWPSVTRIKSNFRTISTPLVMDIPPEETSGRWKNLPMRELS